MAGPAALDYYYGQEAEQYSFYRIPKALFTDERFRRISAEAKVLYGLLLDRMSLSVKNGWMDAENRVFIYFTLEDALELLCCGHTKAVALFAEVEKVGLIERKKQGQGKPTKIYVKNFVTGGEVQTSEKRKSRLPESRTLDFPKTDASNTEKNYTELSDTDLSIHPPLPEPEVRERRPAGGRADAIDTMERMSEYREVILENIAYDVLAQRVDRERLDEVVELLVETVCSRKGTIRIGGEDVDETALSYAEVKALATGDPRIKEKTELETAVSKLKLLKANHDGQKYELEDRLIKFFPRAIQQAREQIKGLEADLQVYRAHPAQGDIFHMVVQGRAYAERKDAGAAILAACKRMTDPEERVPLGEYRGFPMTLWIDSKAEKFMVSLKAGEGLTHTAELGADEVGNIARINNALDIMEKSLAGQRDHLENLTAQMETTREEAARPFPQEEELKEKSARLSVLNVELNMDQGDDAPVADEEHQEPDGKQSIRRMLKELEPAAPPQGGAPRDREMGVAL